MSWVTITESGVKSRLANAELNALRQVQLADGQADPLAEVITRVVSEVRGYVRACPRNQAAKGETIPDNLMDAALAMIRYRLLTRLPVASLLTQSRIDENNQAIGLLKRVAECKYDIPVPADPETTTAAPAGAKLVTGKKTAWGRDNMRDL